ncbi:uncharacterized protein LOC122933641 [Bufo gargarizans]|uniref:uncharacterized protein LOC122933641 n=1 Tax=Bufo gargarizans TaxID=30331 RepID=UPI001CF3B1E4|nr:uncharacterized protein LOC122933641 [Bufo gargarizans]
MRLRTDDEIQSSLLISKTTLKNIGSRGTTISYNQVASLQSTEDIVQFLEDRGFTIIDKPPSPCASSLMSGPPPQASQKLSSSTPNDDGTVCQLISDWEDRDLITLSLVEDNGVPVTVNPVVEVSSGTMSPVVDVSSGTVSPEEGSFGAQNPVAVEVFPITVSPVEECSSVTPSLGEVDLAPSGVEVDVTPSLTMDLFSSAESPGESDEHFFQCTPWWVHHPWS